MAVVWHGITALSCERYLNAAGLSAGCTQQLQQQRAAVKQQLNNLQDAQHNRVAAASSRQADAVEAADVHLADMQAAAAKALRAFAQAVAGRIPLSNACNNPGCVSLAQRSELLLVGGKSCVCARSKAARYCCKACQVEHYKWHKALCRNKAQPAAAAPAAEPEGQEAAAQQ
uniref:MYND-type domain-containing protein n=1 Tax=Tetradesmus obliquus TaxID=3088 RepID=A0A383VAA9_TETOB|eukprot:jgi/Sobl393_1/10816/SZX61870.1